jgi:hypothetical protein
MDINDYQRIQRLASESKEYLFQSIILQNLIGLRTFKVIDYKQYYSKSEMRLSCIEINKFVPKIKEDKINHIAEEAGYSWLDYAINETKKNVYKTIDEKSWRNLCSSEDDALKKLNILSKGGGDSSLTDDFAKKLFSKVMSASKIQEKMSEKGIKVEYILDSHEYEGAVKILKEAELINNRSFKFPNKTCMDLSMKVQKMVDEIAPDIFSDYYYSNNYSFKIGSSITYPLADIDMDILKKEFEDLTVNNNKKFQKNVNEILRRIRKNEINMSVHRILRSPRIDDGVDYVVDSLGDSINVPLVTPIYKFVRSLLLNKFKYEPLYYLVPELKKENEFFESEVLTAMSIYLDPVYTIQKPHIQYWFTHFNSIFKRIPEEDRNWINSKDMNWTSEKRWYERYLDLQMS